MSAKDPVRAYLNSVLECRMEAARCRRKIEMLEARATSTTTQLSGMPSGGGADRDALLAALADATSEYYARLADAVTRELEVSAFIDSLPVMEHRLVMRLRYLDRLRWSGVLAALRSSGLDLSERRMFALHGEALSAAREKFIQKENNDDEIRDSRGGTPDRER